MSDTTTDQRVCVVCDQRIGKAPTGTYYHLSIDWTTINGGGHLAQPKLAHPMDTDPFAGADV